MVKPLPERVKGKVVEEYLKGSSYREISNKTNISLGAISNLIKEAKSIYPDLDELRELRSKLPKNVDIPTLSKAVTSVLDIQSQLGISIEQIPKYIEARKNEIDELSEQIKSKMSEASKLSSKYASLQSEIKQLSKRKVELGEDIQEYEKAKERLAKYGISIKDVGKLRRLLDSLLDYGLDVAKCVKVIEDYSRLKGELDELTIVRDALGYSIANLEEQHTNLSLKVRLKLRDLARKDAEIRELEERISRLKVKVDKLDREKERLIEEIFLEGDRLKEYRIKRNRLKDEVESLKGKLSDLEKMIAERKEQLKGLDYEVNRLKEGVEYYTQSKLAKEIETELKLAESKFYSMMAKATDGENVRLMEYAVKEFEGRVKVIEKSLGIKDKGFIVTIRRS